MDTFKPDWLKNPNIRPYICVRKENYIKKVKKDFDWFDRQPYIVDPLENLGFVKMQMKVDSIMFEKLFTPKWAFYSCAILPGLITGFVMKRDKIPEEIQHIYENESQQEWVPLSIFVVISCISKGHWAAHNLCSLNRLFAKERKLKGLGFLSKAFGLWYFGIDCLYGVTQWNSPALKLHANFGSFELVSAYNPLHNYPNSITYKCRVDPTLWKNFFNKKRNNEIFHTHYQETKITVDPNDEESLKLLQDRLDKKEGAFFLSGEEILKNLLAVLLHYIKQNKCKFFLFILGFSNLQSVKKFLETND